MTVARGEVRAGGAIAVAAADSGVLEELPDFRIHRLNGSWEGEEDADRRISW